MIALGFHNLTLTTEKPARALLNDVSGYVQNGCITAGLLFSISSKHWSVMRNLSDGTICGR
jgi:hypothetical protein